MKKIDLIDKVKIYRPTTDIYGDVTLSEEATVAALFILGYSKAWSSTEETLSTDAHAYLDLDDKFIKKYKNRLEGFYLSHTREGSEQKYRIRNVKIGRSILTDNQDNNVHVRLTKVDL